MSNRETIENYNTQLTEMASVASNLPYYVDTTDGNATSEDILEGKTAYVNGVKVTGTATISAGTDTSDANAYPTSIKEGYTAYVNGEKITGTLEVWSEPVEIKSWRDGIEVFYNDIPDSELEEGAPNRQLVLNSMGPFEDEVVVVSNDYAIYANADDVAEAIGLTADKIVEGETIMGIEGTASAGGVFIVTDGIKFGYSTALPEVLDTSNVTDMSYMFSNCKNLISIPEIDASKVRNLYGMFNNCSNLTDFGGFKDLGKGYVIGENYATNYILDLNPCSNITHESLINVINNLYDLTQNPKMYLGSNFRYRQKLKLGSTNLAKLTDEEIAIATAKGWDVTAS